MKTIFTAAVAMAVSFAASAYSQEADMKVTLVGTGGPEFFLTVLEYRAWLK